MLRTKLFEVRFRTLYNDVFIIAYNLELFYIYLILHKPGDRVKHRMHFIVKRRHHKRAERLTHLNVDLSA